MDAFDKILDIYERNNAQKKLLEKSLFKIASFKYDCGCVPCRGQCKSEEALKSIIDDMIDEAREALGEMAP